MSNCSVTYHCKIAPIFWEHIYDIACNIHHTQCFFAGFIGVTYRFIFRRRLRLPIRLRNPYVDPISLLQVELLQRWRGGERADEDLLRALVATVNGISAGIQNTG